jgi:hypothetical protein
MRIDEEVARFAFEVHLRQYCTDWFVAFTNPTAGPWKRVIAPDASGRWGEVHRFEREELRPDLIVVSDAHRVILIIEAKDDIAKLSHNVQASKSVEALANIAAVAASKRANAYWGERAGYAPVCGLLWGGTSPATSSSVASLFKTYERYLRSVDGIAATILGIECMRGTTDRSVTCAATTSDDGVISPGFTAGALVESLALAAKR